MNQTIETFQVKITIQKAYSSNGKPSKGFTMFGQINENWKWFERWYPTKEAAEKYANKRNWIIEYK